MKYAEDYSVKLSRRRRFPRRDPGECDGVPFRHVPARHALIICYRQVAGASKLTSRSLHDSRVNLSCWVPGSTRGPLRVVGAAAFAGAPAPPCHRCQTGCLLAAGISRLAYPPEGVRECQDRRRPGVALEPASPATSPAGASPAMSPAGASPAMSPAGASPAMSPAGASPAMSPAGASPAMSPAGASPAMSPAGAGSSTRTRTRIGTRITASVTTGPPGPPAAEGADGSGIAGGYG